MPAEWEPHAATWLAWPHNEEDWPGNFAPIPRVFAEIVAHLSAVERVRLIVDGPEREAAVWGSWPSRRRTWRKSISFTRRRIDPGRAISFRCS
jgi:agmatine/peptidylarginine deiminase